MEPTDFILHLISHNCPMATPPVVQTEKVFNSCSFYGGRM